MKDAHRIAILGAGPSGLFMFKRLVESGRKDLDIAIFEKGVALGAGMPYSKAGANEEHITNVSGNEIPDLVIPLAEWISSLPAAQLQHFHIDPDKFHDYKVVPRLLFGNYLTAQFKLLLEEAKRIGIKTSVHLKAEVADICHDREEQLVRVMTQDGQNYAYERVIICTGHQWPKTYEDQVPGYFDSPYPPSKLKKQFNHPIAIKGASLTAIDAIRTLARENGTFSKDKNGRLAYQLHPQSSKFRLVMHSRNGLLPAVRFHLEDSHLAKDSVLSKEEINKNRAENEGFLSLDFVFDQNFKSLIRQLDPDFYEDIKEMNVETFVEAMMALREELDPFLLFEAEYAEAAKSIRRRKSVIWKEMLAVLSFAMNYPAKYFSAEDMQRLQRTLMPLISIVIAFVPQSSVEDLLALYDAGVLSLLAIGEKSEVEVLDEGGVIYHYTNEQGQRMAVPYEVFIDCVGQPHLSFEDLPYQSLLRDETVSPAMLKFKDQDKGKAAFDQEEKQVVKDLAGNYYLKVPGIAVNDCFQVVDRYAAFNPQLYMMAVPYMGGFNPDYSGLDFCEAASARISESLLSLCHEK